MFVRTLATPRDIDLIQFQGTNRTLRFDEDLPADEYERMRLSVVAEPNVIDSFMALDAGGQNHLLKPVVRVVDTLQVGAIAGNVDLGLRAACAASPRPTQTTTARPGSHRPY